jgi:hypothetical protein
MAVDGVWATELHALFFWSFDAYIEKMVSNKLFVLKNTI